MHIETLASLATDAGISMPVVPERRAAVSAPSPGFPVAGSADYNTLTFGLPSYTGRPVTQATAMTFSAVYSAVSQIAGTCASLALHTYRELDSTRKVLATSDYRYRMLRFQPNPEMSSFQWREEVLKSLLLWGNSYNFLETDARGQIKAIWPMRPDWTLVQRNPQRRLVYSYFPADISYDPVPAGDYSADYILHIPGLGYDGTLGYSPITMAKQAIALGLAAQEYAARMHANNSRPNLLLTNEGAHVDPENFKKLWQQSYGGLENAGKVAVLSGGKWQVQTFSMNPRDAQFLEGRNFEISEIARWYNMPPNRLGDPNGKAATYASAEQADLDYAKHTIRPWLERIEQKINMTILGSRDALVAKHDMTELLRGDLNATATAYGTFVEKGIMLRDEVRSRIDMNPLPDGAGEVPTCQQQTIPLSAAIVKPEPISPVLEVPNVASN